MDVTVYKTFWRRFGASWVDPAVTAPVTLLLSGAIYLVLRTQSESAWLLSSYFAGLVTIPYSIYFHGRWGQTVGKMAMGVRVVDADGEGPITYWQAILREIPNVALTMLSFWAVWTLWNSDPESWFVERPDGTIRVDGGAIAALAFVGGIYIAWTLAEVLTMATNTRRRSIHDFIAGTVVVKTSYQAQVWPRTYPDSSVSQSPGDFKGEAPASVQLAVQRGLLQVDERPAAAIPPRGAGMTPVVAGFTHPGYTVGWRRFWGACLDGLLFAVISLITIGGLQDAMGGGGPGAARAQALACLLYAGYDTVLHAAFGKTLGKAAAGLTVVDAATLGPITWRHASFRAISLWWTGAAGLVFASLLSDATGEVTVPFIADEAWLIPAWVCMLATPQRRALHDLIAGTTVIREEYEPVAAISSQRPAAAAGW